MARSKNTTFISICLSYAEKQLLDDAVAERAERTGTKPNRNRFLRDMILRLTAKP